MYDVGLSDTPPVFASESNTGRFPVSEPRDLQLCPESISSASFTVDSNGSFACAGIVAPSVSFLSDGADLDALLTQAEYDRVKPGQLSNANFADGALTGLTFEGVLPVSLGGTGRSNAPPAAAEGSLVLGDGDDPLGAATFSFGNDAMGFPPGGIQLGSNFLFAFSNGSLWLSALDEDVSVDLSALELGVLPTVADLTVSLNASNAGAVGVSWTTRHEDRMGKAVYFKLVRQTDFAPLTGYQLAQSVEGSAEDLGALTATESNMRLALAVGAVSETSSFSIEGLEEITDYRLLSVTVGKTGSVSPVATADFRTTEYGAPVVVSVSPAQVVPTAVSFAASNDRDISEMLVVAGLFCSPNLATGPEFQAYAEGVRAASGADYAFYETVISPATDCNAFFVFTKCYNNVSGGFESVQERETYYPFVYYVDGESNATLCNLAPVYNPDVTAPVLNNFREDDASRSPTTIFLEWDPVVDP